MKFLAILRDSLREAIDTKVFYATAVISILIVLLVGSVRYQPVTAKEEFERYTELLNWAMDMATNGQPVPHYSTVDFSQTNDATEPWNGNYRFTLIVQMPLAEQKEKLKSQFTPEHIRQQYQQTFPWIKEFHVAELQANDPKEFRYLIQTTGTNITDRREWFHEPQPFFGAWKWSLLHMPLSKILERITDDMIGTFGAGFTLFLGIIITAFFIPNMLRKGTVDMLIVKPMGRSQLLTYKFFGGLTFMFLNTLFIMAGIWLALGLQAGVWMSGLLLCIFIFTFQFAIFYAISTLTAVMTQSPIIPILSAIVAWLAFVVVGWAYSYVEEFRQEKASGMRQARMLDLPDWALPVVDAIHFLTPHYKDLDKLTTKLVRSDLLPPTSPEWKKTEKEVGSINWAESIGVSLAFIALMLGLSCWWFSTRDY